MRPLMLCRHNTPMYNYGCNFTSAMCTYGYMCTDHKLDECYLKVLYTSTFLSQSKSLPIYKKKLCLQLGIIKQWTDYNKLENTNKIIETF